MSLTTIIGISVVCFLILWFAFQWDKKEHVWLQLIAAGFFIFMLLLVPKAAIDSHDICDTVIANQTIYGNVTSFEYDTYCYSPSYTTEFTFYKAYTGFIVVFIFYILIYFIRRILGYAVDVASMRKKK